MRDVELVGIELETLWARDARGRLVADEQARSAPHLAIGCAREGQIVVLGADVREELAEKLMEMATRSPARGDRAQPPEALDACEALLRRELGPVVRSAGPGYFIWPGTAFEAQARIVRAGDAEAARLRPPPPDEARWEAEEWASLIAGGLGPCAFAIEGGEVVSICHCARLRERGAEAGVWTHSAHRGRGYAPAVTAAWAALVHETGRHAFYSTSADNQSSQRVAARLGARPIGWVWTLSARR